MRILISNDDGIDAQGLQVLADAMEPFGTVYVIAPDRERSASSHSLTLHRPIRIHPRGKRRFAVDGTPTDCVNLGILEILKDEPPALVVAGVNHGPNLGDDVIYSGTVSAALEGALLGVPSVAISLTVLNDEETNFEPATKFIRRLIRKVLQKTLHKGMILNVNIPNIQGTDIQNYEITRLGKRRYAGAIAEKIDPRGRKYYWIGGESLGFDDNPGSDCNAIKNEKISITPIRLDLTHDECLGDLKEWNL